MNKKRLQKRKNQFVLVTGSSRGIGYSFVKAFLKKGYSILACSRKTDNILDLQSQYPEQKIITFNYDLAIPENCQQLFNDTAKYKPIIIVNNAGIMNYGQFENSKRFHQEFMLDVYAVYTLNKLFYTQMMQENYGVIINVASTIAFINTNHFAGYQSAKSYVLNLSKDLALEAKVLQKKVKIYAVCPGLTATALVDNSPMNYNRLAMNSDRCVRIALRKIFLLRYWKPTIITGLTNILLVRLVFRILPRWLKILIFRASLRRYQKEPVTTKD